VLSFPRLSLAQATVASIAVDGTVAVAMVAVTPYLIDRLGVGPYGIVIAVAVLTGQLGVLQLGIGPATVRRSAELRGCGDEAGHAATVRAAIVAGIVAAVLVAAGFAMVAAWVWHRGFQVSPEVLEQAIRALPAATAVAAAQPLLNALYGLLSGDERFACLSGLRLIQGIGRLGGMVAAVALGGGVAGALWAQALIDAFVVLLTSAAVLQGIKGRLWSGDLRAALRSLLSVGVPFAGAELFAALLMDLEKLALGFLRSIEAFTYYAVPFAAVFRLAGFGLALHGVLLPRLAALAASGRHEAAAELTHRATRVAVAVMAVLLAPVIACTPELLHLWIGPEFAEQSGFATRLLLVAMLANVAVYPAHAAVRAVARPGTLARLYAAELIFHFALVFAAILLWGIPGAALAWGLRVIVDAAAHRQIALTVIGRSIGPWREVVLPLVLLGVLAVAFHLGDDAVPVASRLAIGIACSVGAFLWLLPPREWHHVRQLLRPGGGDRHSSTPPVAQWRSDATRAEPAQPCMPAAPCVTGVNRD
jgi:O-antigen/teichoic acid export membrane protein